MDLCNAKSMRKVWLFCIALILLSIGGFTYYKLYSKQQSNLSPDLSKTPETALLAQIATWYPPANWSSPKVDKQTTLNGNFAGESISATVTTQQANLSHFEDANTLKQMGYVLDNNLSADGPGSSNWGYSNTNGTTRKIIIFSYSVKPSNTNPNEPVQFNCPCATKVNVFVGTSVSPTATLANPASTNCIKQGGTLVIKKNGTGGEYGLCDFGDNMQCEEWALFRGDCPVGGRKTTGFDSIQEKYCAWLGGTTYAVTNATCQLPNGHTCSDTALYNGSCQ